MDTIDYKLIIQSYLQVLIDKIYTGNQINELKDINSYFQTEKEKIILKTFKNVFGNINFICSDTIDKNILVLRINISKYNDPIYILTRICEKYFSQQDMYTTKTHIYLFLSKIKIIKLF